MRKYLLWVVLIIVLIGGVIVGLLLVQQQQIFKQKASVSTGVATVSIQPATATFERGTSNLVSVNFNTHGVSISEVNVKITYSNLGITALGVNTSAITTSGDWACPVKTVSTSGSTDEIDIACTNSAVAGYSNNVDTLLATFDITASQVPLQNPVIFSFDPVGTTIKQKSDGADISLTPNSTGSYTITDTIATSPTATPLLVVSSPTATPTGSALALAATATPTSTSTSNPLATATATPLATASSTKPPMPVTGFDGLTLIGGIGGVSLLLLGAFVLIF